ncbi:hypothetical protein DAPPUDRAFT_299908 [Daphnia pulex]|uniref:Uncharacterized protein n=1 Tax=Daphnia pulex TaxID=6669 RepID=E9FQY6_DAPPU|nr:hypothetical protein DAPPUDRAFT_299908 [Daphnia pulex]|eukprot:EFX90282.1 hypothetical protein DAPPUDRAFT_299908 [Daphnia pulex]
MIERYTLHLSIYLQQTLLNVHTYSLLCTCTCISFDIILPLDNIDRISTFLNFLFEVLKFDFLVPSFYSPHWTFVL